jgi:hypothetical protein
MVVVVGGGSVDLKTQGLVTCDAAGAAAPPEAEMPAATEAETSVVRAASRRLLVNANTLQKTVRTTK